MGKLFKILIISMMLFCCGIESTDTYANSTDMKLSSLEEAYLNRIKDNTIEIAVIKDFDKNIFIANELKNAFNINLKLKYYNTFGELYTDLVKGDVDIFTELSYTEERAKFMYFSTPVTTENIYVYHSEYLGYKELNNRDLIVLRDTVYLDVIKDHTHISYSSLTEVDSDDEAYQLMKTDINYVYISNDSGYKKMINYGYKVADVSEYIYVTPVSIATAKKEYEKLLSIFAKYMSTKSFTNKYSMYRNETITKLHKDYLEIVKDTVEIDEDKVYKVVVHDYTPHITYRDGEFTGYMVEVLDRLFKYANLKYEIVNKNNELTWNDMYEDTLLGKYDLVASMIHTPEREELFYFTDITKDVSTVMITRKNYYPNHSNILELIHEPIGVIKNTYFHLKLDSMFPYKEFKEYANQDELLEGLINGEVNYVPFTEFGYSKFIKDNRDFRIRIDAKVGNLFKSEEAFVTPRNEEGYKLAEVLNAASPLIDYGELTNKYMYEVTLEELQEIRFMITISISLLIITLLIMITIIISRKTRIDKLTKFYNRHVLEKKYGKKVPNTHTIIYVDLNSFKKINDTYGHHIGDYVIKHYLKNYKHYNKLDIYRMGGDEFVIVTNLEKKGLIIGDIIDSLSEVQMTLPSNDLKLYITASLGIYQVNRDSKGIDYDLKVVDYAMYKSKKQKTKCSFVSEKLITEFNDSQIYERNLVDAINNGNIEARFDLIVNLENSSIAAIELKPMWKYKDQWKNLHDEYEILKKHNLRSIVYNFTFDRLNELYLTLINININLDEIHLINKVFTFNSIDFEKNKSKLINIPKEKFILLVESKYTQNIEVSKSILNLLKHDYWVAIDNITTWFEAMSNNYTHSNCTFKLNIDQFLGDKLNEEGKKINKTIISGLTRINKTNYFSNIKSKDERDLIYSCGSKYASGSYFYNNVPSEEVLEILKTKQLL